MDKEIRRPDTGTQRNMIMEIAASIMSNSAQFNELVADQHRKKGKVVEAEHWQKEAQEIRTAIATIDRLMGCWS